MRKGFTLLEAVIAIVILAGTLVSISRIVMYSYRYSEKVEKIYQGTELAWLKMHDVDVEIDKNGIPTMDKEEEGDFEDNLYEGFRWYYSIKKVYMPMPDLNVGSEADDVNDEMTEAASTLSMVQPMIEDFFKVRVRKLTVKIMWGEGVKESEKVELTKFINVPGTVTDFSQSSRSISTSTTGTSSSNSASKTRGPSPMLKNTPLKMGK